MRLGWWLSSEEHDPRTLVAHALAAEEVGFTTAMISDHLQPWTRQQGSSPFVWSVLGAIAHATERIELGTGVTAFGDRSSPINVAQAAATIAVMSEGRFFLGVGSGERLNEQPFGGRWPRAGERRERMEEAIAIVRALWSGDTVNRRGTWFATEQLELATRPASPPPLLVAASGARSARLAAEQADGMIAVAPDVPLVDTFRGSGGAEKRCVAQIHVSLAATDEAAREQAWRWWSHGVVPPAVLSELARPDDFHAIADAIGPGPLDETVVCATTVDPIVATVDRYAGAGFDTVYLHQVGPDQRRLLDAAPELLAHYGA